MENNGQPMNTTEESIDFEKMMYRKSLKQVVIFMNDNLDKKVSDKEISPKEFPVENTKSQKTPDRHLRGFKTRDSKKKINQHISKRSHDNKKSERITVEQTTPTLSDKKRKRVNKYSKMKYDDIVQKRKDKSATRKVKKGN
ncbi:hypothetical protein PAEPH01_0693 [Pancytospora epiphaga]|nr:hypothetical protein PAEPH01_0693 [Pancytospora epiphaga]